MYRNPRIRESARYESCVNCGSEGAVVWAHSNQLEHGKGKSVKAHDIFGAYLCFLCHGWLDQGSGMDPTGVWTGTREDKKEFFRRAMDKSLLRLVTNGVLK